MKKRRKYLNIVEWNILLKSKQLIFSIKAENNCLDRMSEDLNRLITATSQQPKPFILVGSDLGAVVTRFYTQMYEL